MNRDRREDGSRHAAPAADGWHVRQSGEPRLEELIEKDVLPQVIDEGTRRHETWRTDRQAALASGRTPWVAVNTMTEWTAEDAAGVVRSSGRSGRAPEAEVVTMAAAVGRPAGARFGTLVHAALATVPLDAVAA